MHIGVWNGVVLLWTPLEQDNGADSLDVFAAELITI